MVVSGQGRWVRVVAGLAGALAVSCGGNVERNADGMGLVPTGADADEMPRIDDAEADRLEPLNLGLLEVWVLASEVPLRTLAYTVETSSGRLIQSGSAELVERHNYDPSIAGTRADLVFSISLPPGRGNLLDWEAELGHVTCEGALGPFQIEALKTVTYLSEPRCHIFGR